MKPELKRKWIAALKSGKYRQAHGSLEERGAFCCLGVLCHIAGVPREVAGPFIRYDGKSGELTEERCEQLGLDYNVMLELAKLNDGGPYVQGEGGMAPLPFAEIAEHIRGAV